MHLLSSDTGAKGYEFALDDPYMLHGPLLTWSADMRIAVVFSKQQAAEAEAKIRPALFLCVNIPKSALFRRVYECGRFFDEEA